MQNEKLVTSLFDLVTELKNIINAQKTEIQTMDALIKDQKDEIRKLTESSTELIIESATQKVSLQKKDEPANYWRTQCLSLRRELRVTEQMRLHDLATANCYRTRCAELEKELSTLAIQKVDKKLSKAITKDSQSKSSEEEDYDVDEDSSSDERELAEVDDIVEALELKEDRGYWVYPGSDEFVFGDFVVGKVSTLVCIGVREKDGGILSLYIEDFSPDFTKRLEKLAKRKKVKLVHLQQVWEKMQKESRKVMIFKGLADF